MRNGAGAENVLKKPEWRAGCWTNEDPGITGIRIQTGAIVYVYVMYAYCMQCRNILLVEGSYLTAEFLLGANDMGEHIGMSFSNILLFQGPYQTPKSWLRSDIWSAEYIEK